jgi:hypothetical protein
MKQIKNKHTRKARLLLERMENIECMQRGKVCPMTGRPYYNHQTWQDGRNVVRYVPDSEVQELQKAIDGYALFQRLAEQYADEIIRITRAKQKKRKQHGKD